MGALMKAYNTNAMYDQSLECFDEMQKCDRNEVVYVMALSACAHNKALDKGRAIHSETIEYSDNTNVNNALIFMYGMCGHIQSVQQIVQSMGESQMDTYTLNSVLKSYNECNLFHQTLQYLCEESKVGLRDDISYL